MAELGDFTRNLGKWRGESGKGGSPVSWLRASHLLWGLGIREEGSDLRVKT